MTTTAHSGGGLQPIAIYLRGLREQMGITQAALAKTMDITPRHLARWEAGETQIGSGPLLRAILSLPTSTEHLRQLMREDATVETARRLAEERLTYIHTQNQLREQVQQGDVENLLALIAASPGELAELRAFLQARAAEQAKQAKQQ